MKRVLVTGATGFIGRHTLLPLLERGFEVHATYFDEPLDIEGVSWHQVDLLDEHSTKRLCGAVRASHLLHFAWYVSPIDYKTSPENERWVKATLSLLRAFKESGGMRASLAGTCMEYDWNIPQDLLSEDSSPLRPSTPYGAAKLETYTKAAAFAKEKSLSLAWGRIFLLFGPHEAPTRLVPYVINQLLRGRPAECTSGEQIRDIMYVKDVAEAFVALLDSNVQGAVNIGTGVPVVLKDVICMIADMLGKRELLRLGAKETLNDPPRLVFDVTRLQKEVGWQPRHSLEEGLRETIQWWEANGSTNSPYDRA